MMVELIAFVGTIIAFPAACYSLDKILSPQFKRVIHNNILKLNERTASQYVTEISLKIFDKIFNANFLSWNFFLKSTGYTVLLAALSLITLYAFFEPLFYAVTAHPRNAFFENDSILLCMLPLIPIFMFDYFCNGITRYFLAWMKEINRTKRVLLLGYSSVVTTMTIAIVSISLSVVFYTFLETTFRREELSFVVYFQEMKQRYEGENESVSHYATILTSDFEKRMYRLDLDLARKFGGDSRGTFNIVETEEDSYVNILNEEGTIQSISSMRLDTDIRAQSLRDPGSTWPKYCQQFSEATLYSKFSLIIHAGWNTSEIYENCLKGVNTRIAITASLNHRLANYFSYFAETISNLLEVSLFALAHGNSYFTTLGSTFMDSRSFEQNIYYSERVEGTVFASKLAHYAYENRISGSRLYYANGYPWSTFLIATFGTSLLIWIAVLATLFLYFFLLGWEVLSTKFDHDKPIMLIEEYPFTAIAIIVSIYFSICYVAVKGAVWLW